MFATNTRSTSKIRVYIVGLGLIQSRYKDCNFCEYFWSRSGQLYSFWNFIVVKSTKNKMSENGELWTQMNKKVKSSDTHANLQNIMLYKYVEYLCCRDSTVNKNMYVWNQEEDWRKDSFMFTAKKKKYNLMIDATKNSLHSHSQSKQTVPQYISRYPLGEVFRLTQPVGALYSIEFGIWDSFAFRPLEITLE